MRSHSNDNSIISAKNEIDDDDAEDGIQKVHRRRVYDVRATVSDYGSS
jgi:hypothetical protein